MVACACAAVTFEKSTPVTIIKQESDTKPDGSYHYSFESEDGQGVEQTGHLKTIGKEVAVTSEGSYHYTLPNGTVVSVKYIADENGFQPLGTHLPVAPPVPQAILRGLEFIRTHPHVEEEEKHKNGF